MIFYAPDLKCKVHIKALDPKPCKLCLNVQEIQGVVTVGLEVQ